MQHSAGTIQCNPNAITMQRKKVQYCKVQCAVILCMQYNTVCITVHLHCNAVCSTVHYTVYYNTMQCTVHYTILFITVQFRYSTVHYNAVYSTVHFTVCYSKCSVFSTVRCVVQYRTVQYSTLILFITIPSSV